MIWVTFEKGYFPPLQLKPIIKITNKTDVFLKRNIQRFYKRTKN